MNLTELIKKYGSDKSLSGYDIHYKKLFKFFVNKNINYLEIGLGTLIGDLPSTFIGNPSHYPHYKPSAVLKVWREYFKNANIYGIDIGKDCMLENEERITTKIVDSTSEYESNNCFPNISFDIILDDGLHTSEGQRKTFNNFFSRVKENGLYVIEDLGGGGDGKNMFVESYDEIMSEINKHEYFFGGNILVVYKNNSNKGNIGIDELVKSLKEGQNGVIDNIEENNLTIVTGLWNINRVGRDFNHYIESFKRFLDIPQNLFIYIPKEYEYLVWEKRSKENTFVKIYELEDVKRMYQPFWSKTQSIRNSEKWLNQAGWLSNSPQAANEWYNPIVQSKMFLLNDVTIWNPFDTEYFFWLDAGITNTVPHGHLAHSNVLEKLTEYANPFLFLSYPYEANTEIHGFDFNAINKYSGKKVEYVCRGGLFGGHKMQINEANATYYSLLDKTLSSGYMGTEESIFSIMANIEPDIYRRFELDGNGLIVKFTQALLENNVKLVDIPKPKLLNNKKYTDRDVNGLKTNLYILTFNFPEQVLHTIESMKKTPEWLEKPKLVLLDNSTDSDAKTKNKEIANQYNFEYIDLGGNTGICGGRQAAAEHFDKSDADYMFFFEDDMTVNPPELEGEVCRNGFRKYISNLYNILHKIMLRDKFDFLKLSFTEVYFDNDKQCSWYNVPQHIRTEFWPHYDKLPVSGLDPNVPLTEFKNIRNMDGVTYIDGEIYYANWPMIVSKEGNKKMFINTTWAHPFEQTWMSHMHQMTKKGELKPALLLASPIWHDRIKHYKPEERREN
jgi:hypothetical protein